MTPEEIADLEKMYQEVNKGSHSPDYMEASVPEIGYVQFTKKGILVEECPATEEQVQAITQYFKPKCTPLT